jgi:hypothetical protein
MIAQSFDQVRARADQITMLSRIGPVMLQRRQRRLPRGGVSGGGIKDFHSLFTLTNRGLQGIEWVILRDHSGGKASG